MPIIGRTKVLPQLLEDTRQLLAKAWTEGGRDGGLQAPGGPRADGDPRPPTASDGIHVE
jgi:hypothetical protein